MGMGERRFRIKATQVDGKTHLGDYMSFQVWNDHYWPSRREREQVDPMAPRQRAYKTSP
jgi:hypothetical protein